MNSKENSTFQLPRWLKSILFAAGGTAVGFIYYKTVGCPSGSCAITSSVTSTMAYFGLIGFWLSFVLGGGCCCSGGSCGIPSGKNTGNTDENDLK